MYSVKSSNHAFKKRSNWIDAEGAVKGTYLMHTPTPAPGFSYSLYVVMSGPVKT